jgi:hypothetical protein
MTKDEEKSEICLFVITTNVRGPRRRDGIVVGFTTTYAISAYHH